MSQLSNYPPGVTGNEPYLKGAEWEQELERYCEVCEENAGITSPPQSGLAESWDGLVSWTCDSCGHEVDITDEFKQD
jgi:hypothetical protein